MRRITWPELLPGCKRTTADTYLQHKTAPGTQEARAFKQVELHSRHRVKPSCLDAPIPEASRAPLMLDRKLDPHSLTDPG